MERAATAEAGLPELLHSYMTYRLVMTASAVAAIRALAPESADGRETGGILIGRGPDADGLIVVDQAGDAGPGAIRRADFFLRDRAHAERLAEAAWDDRQAVWVGDWHTHPMGGPQPSERDLRTYTGLLAAAELEFEVFTSIIVVPDPTAGWERPVLTPWLFPRTDTRRPH